MGHVVDGAAADYDPDEDLIDVPEYMYGLYENERCSLIHECVHAYHDMLGKNMRGVWDESIA